MPGFGILLKASVLLGRFEGECLLCGIAPGDFVALPLRVKDISDVCSMTEGANGSLWP